MSFYTVETQSFTHNHPSTHNHPPTHTHTKQRLTAVKWSCQLAGAPLTNKHPIFPSKFLFKPLFSMRVCVCVLSRIPETVVTNSFEVPIASGAGGDGLYPSHPQPKLEGL